MLNKGKIIHPETELREWPASEFVEEISLNQIRYSRGFLRLNLNHLFPNFQNHWFPLFKDLKLNLKVVELTISLDFPERLSRLVPILINGERAIIGMDDRTKLLLSQCVANRQSEYWQEIVAGYFERRILSTLSKAWVAEDSLTCQYLGTELSETVEVVGAINVLFEVNDQKGELWFGLGPKITEKLDDIWKEVLKNNFSERSALSSQNDVSIEIAEINVSPAMVTDFLKPNTIVDLETESSNRVFLRKDGEVWAEGTLFSFNNRFAVRIDKFISKINRLPEWSTNIAIEICSISLNSQSLPEYFQEGVFLLTGTRLFEGVRLRISGEQVADGRLLVINDRLAVEILQR